MSNLGFGVSGVLLGNFWAYMLNLSAKNLNDFYIALIIKFVSSFLPLFMLGLVPNKEHIEKDSDLKRLNSIEPTKAELLLL